MKIVYLVFMLLPLASTAASEEDPACAAAEAKSVSTIKELPDEVQSILADRQSIADIGEKFTATDVIVDRTLPRQRLMSAVLRKDCQVTATIEYGGHGYHVGTMVLTKVGEHWAVVSQNHYNWFLAHPVGK